jgi:hypothetical protein
MDGSRVLHMDGSRNVGVHIRGGKVRELAFIVEARTENYARGNEGTCSFSPTIQTISINEVTQWLKPALAQTKASRCTGWWRRAHLLRSRSRIVFFEPSPWRSTN